MGKRAMSRRIRRQYQSILLGVGHEEHYPWWRYTRQRYNKWSNESLNAHAAMLFYADWGCHDGVDFHRLQNMVIRHGNPETIYMWARRVPNANIRRCQAAIMERGTAQDLRLFALNVEGAHKASLEALIVVKEVLAM